MFRHLVAAALPIVPKPIVRSIAMRYVAGESSDDAVHCVRDLNAKGLQATVALLGEEVTEQERVDQATQTYVDLLKQLDGLDTGISIKLTLLGLEIDKEYCYRNLVRVLEAAENTGVGEGAEAHTLVRLDMEDHTCTDATLELFARARADYDHVGIVLQAYLHRTLDDIAGLPADSNVRICKGIYIEPRDVAIQSYEKIRKNFMACVEALFDAGATVGIATHDELLIQQSLESIERRGLEKRRYEFQTLLGVMEHGRDDLRSAGHAVRVYVPYGDDWYLYSVRRLRENPQIALYVLRALFSRRR